MSEEDREWFMEELRKRSKKWAKPLLIQGDEEYRQRLQEQKPKEGVIAQLSDNPSDCDE